MIKKIPFDINTAKAIVRGDLKGNIIAEMGDNAVIYDFDFNRTDGTKGFAAKVETKYGSIVKASTLPQRMREKHFLRRSKKTI